VSIHSNHATAEVLEELSNQPISVPVLHWWSASRGRTRSAVGIGCCFSINPRIAQYSIFSTLVPLDRVLIERDLDYDAPPDQIPTIVEAAERVVAEKYQVKPGELRRMMWKNLGSISQRLDGAPGLPEALNRWCRRAEPDPGGEP
jgi:TatD DNase family protein